LPYIKVNTTKLKNYSSEFDSCRSRILDIQNRLGTIAKAMGIEFTLAANISTDMLQIAAEMEAEINSLHNMKVYCYNAARCYASLDGDVLEDDKPATTTPLPTEPSQENSEETKDNVYWDWLGASAENGEAIAYLGHGHAEGDWGWGNASVDTYIGKAKAWWDVDFDFYGWKREKEKGDEKAKDSTKFFNLGIEAGASAELVQSEGEVVLGDGNLGFTIAGEGSVGKAGAALDVHVGYDKEKGFTAKGEAEAIVAAAKGEAKASFSFLGFDFTFKIGGYAGALGVEAEYVFENGKFSGKAGFAALFGFSLGFEIGFNDAAKDNWNAVTDWVENAAEDVTDWVEDAAESVGNWVENAVEDVTDWVGNAVEDVGNWVGNAAEDVGNWLANGWNKLWSW